MPTHLYLLLAAQVAVAGTLSWTSWFGPVALVVLAVVWLQASTPWEGQVLVGLGPDHGITAADLVSAAGLVVAAARLVSLARGT